MTKANQKFKDVNEESKSAQPLSTVEDNVEIEEGVIEDEPQFKSPKDEAKNGTKKKKSPVSGVILLAFAAVVGVVGYGYIDDLNADKKSKTVASAKLNSALAVPFVEEPAGDSYTFSEVAIEPSNSAEDVAITSDSFIPVPTEVDITLIDSRILETLLKLEAQFALSQSEIGSLKRQLASVERGINQQFGNLDNGMKNVGTLVSKSVQSGSANGKVIDRLVNMVSGFNVDIAQQRNIFDFKILHSEYWGGRYRLIGYTAEAPDSMLRIYEGETVGLWQLTDIDGSLAKFTHKDGHKHEVAL